MLSVADGLDGVHQSLNQSINLNQVLHQKNIQCNLLSQDNSVKSDMR